MKIHFIGIGGIAISGLASIYLQKGYKVQGSDFEESEITKELRTKNVKVFFGHSKRNVNPGLDLVIYSEAVPEDNIEIEQAKTLNIKCQTGAQALGEFSKDYFTIAVSGMHGKTTTACMIAKVLTEAGLDPTYIIGTKSGSRLGKSKYLVLEADDYKAKLLNYHPNIAVLTNIEEEHLDYFKDLNHILKVFREYVGQVQDLIVANKNDKNIKRVIEQTHCKVKYFEPQSIKLQVPGLHNQYNAAAALEVAHALEINDKIARESLCNYKGTWRRFEEKNLKIEKQPFGESACRRLCKLKIILDYAHHPTEIAATLQAAQEKFPNKKIWCVFQPHQYQRTFYLFKEFVKTFQRNPLKKLIITDIYDVVGRENEEIKKKVSAKKLAKTIGKKWTMYLPQDKIINYLKKNLKDGEVVILMGAGDIYKLMSILSKKSSR